MNPVIWAGVGASLYGLGVLLILTIFQAGARADRAAEEDGARTRISPH